MTFLNCSGKETHYIDIPKENKEDLSDSLKKGNVMMLIPKNFKEIPLHRENVLFAFKKDCLDTLSFCDNLIVTFDESNHSIPDLTQEATIRLTNSLKESRFLNNDILTENSARIIFTGKYSSFNIIGAIGLFKKENKNYYLTLMLNNPDSTYLTGNIETINKCLNSVAFK
jgi:hypothetical protein